MFANPERIAIGGGISKQWEKLYPRMMETIKERTLQPLVEVCDVVKAELKDDIGILGAAAIIM
jgi:glucokinase